MSGLTEKYINPLTDFGFKKLFGSEPNKALLIDFLNEILPDKKIKDLSYTSTENLGITEVDRKAIFDLYCIGDDGDRFIVEMQKAKQNFFKDRSVFYASFPIQEQARKTPWDYKLQPVYSVGILDFIFDDHKDDKELLHIVQLKNQRVEVFYKKLMFVYLELRKFKKEAHELTTKFDKWLYVLRHLSDLDKRPPALKERVFKKLFEVAEIAKFSPKERDAYESSLKYFRDMQNVIDTAREEGEEVGFADGREMGRAEGRAEGQEVGRKNMKIEMAKEMKAANESIEKIKKYTGLSSAEIKEL